MRRGRWRVVALAALAVTGVAVVVWLAQGIHGDTGVLAVTGTIEARQVDVSAKITGRIVELAVREGQTVTLGQLIARLDTETLAADVRRAEAALRTAEAQLADLRAGSRSQEIEQARANLRNTEATRVWTERELERTRALHGRELVALQEVERARQAHDVAVGNEAAARQRLDLVEAGPRPLDADLWLRAYVPETDIGRVKIGQAARIAVDAFPGRRFEGAISEIGSEAEYTPRNVQTKKERVNLVFRIKIAVKNPDGVLKPGMPADAEITP